MTSPWFSLALGLYLVAAGGFTVFIIRQHPWVFRYSYWILVAGFVFHTVFLGHGYYRLGTAPVLDLRSALSFFAWCLAGVYLVAQVRFKLRVLGSFVAPLAAFLMSISSAVPLAADTVKPLFKSIWLTVHVGTVFTGDALLCIAFLAGVMYLIQEGQIKKKRLGSMYSRLPSLATLDSINYHAIIYGFPFLTVGMISGSIYAQVALGHYWQWDPKEVWSLISWLFYAALLHQRLAVGWQGKNAAVLSIVCFGTLIFTFVGVSLFMEGYHSFSSMGAR
ncbi:MAG: c-type cytochrome biogenesis protein CcsB [Deltaproteobacteria bacterium]|nr:c-type cytochrome biogenesis protein CcsB [Deltaproteobacteria bacterium]OQX64969.1 MAG: c-type cytochrome biogenesis protein CcsB [Desulfococcus sp. 4484_242]